MSVDDHGLEGIRKSAHEVVPGNKAEYYLLVDLLNAITGTFIQQTISDPSDGIRVTRKTVGDTEVRFPLVGETIHANRNTISIRNSDGTNFIYVHVKTPFTAGWVEAGVKGPQAIGPNESFNTPCDNDVYFYIKCESGKSARVEFSEYA